MPQSSSAVRPTDGLYFYLFTLTPNEDSRDRQCIYKVTLWRVRVTVVVVDATMHSLCVVIALHVNVGLHNNSVGSGKFVTDNSANYTRHFLK